MPFVQYRAFWSVPGAGVGITNFRFASPGTGDIGAAAAAVRAFFAGHTSQLPNDVSITFASEATIHSDSGTLIGTMGGFTVPATVTGSGSGPWAGGVGIKHTWDTSAILNGKRISGSTFVVPTIATVFDTDGTILAGTLTSLTTTGATLRTSLASAAMPLAVWSKVNAATVVVTGNSVKDKTAIMRSRRD